MENPIPRWLTKFWDSWDVRIMVLLSLAIQVILFYLGSHRRYVVKSWLRIILWSTYLMADWIATAALGQLSKAQAKTIPPNVLSALWAPILLLHLGGPDTITAYVLEDNLLWKRHLLGLVVQVYLVIYVLALSITSSWVTLMMYGLMLIAGLIKYIERTRSLMVASSGQPEKTIPVFQIDALVEDPKNLSDEEKLVVAYQFFSAFRPDITNYISPRENISSSGTKLLMRFMDNVRMTGLSNVNMHYLLQTLDGLDVSNLFEILEIELKFMFEVMYTKAPVTYTKVGCLLRFISVCCSLYVLILFLTLLRRNQYSLVDVIITWILLVGAIVIELYAIGRFVYSDWTAIWIKSRHSQNRFVWKKRILGAVLSLLSTMRKQIKEEKQKKKRWSGSFGQFNLVSYCFKYKKEWKIFTDIGKLKHRHQHTKFERVPDMLKDRDFSNSFSTSSEFSFIATRGERALKEYNLLEDLRWSIELDFDESIITWHLVTDICYHIRFNDKEDSKKVNNGRLGEETKEICQVISNYMMYLLVMQSDMIIPGYRKDFWFSHVSETLGGFFEKKVSKKNEHESYNLLVQRTTSPGASELEENAAKIVRKFLRNEKRWEIMEAVWLEMLCYAAVACQHVNHVRQLRRGGEYLTHLWLQLNMAFLKKSN